MMSILLSFSRRVAGGVLTCKKSNTKIALKAHIGRLRSIPLVHDNDHVTNQVTPTEQPSPVEKNKTH